jgi:hypothetical protein
VPDINARHDARQRLHVESPACANNAASFLALQYGGSHYVVGLKTAHYVRLVNLRIRDQSNTRGFAARIELDTTNTIPWPDRALNLPATSPLVRGGW